MSNYTLWCFGYRSAAWGQIEKGMRACCSLDGWEDGINCPNCPVCVTYIPVYTTKPRPAKKTISDGQTTQRNSHSVNNILPQKHHLRWEEKLRCTLEFHLCSESKQRSGLLIQSEVLFSNAHTVWHGNKVPLLLLLLYAEEGCLQGVSCPVPSTYGSIKPQERACWKRPRKQVRWKPAIQVHEGTFPMPLIRIHVSKKEHFQRLFIS